ERPPLAPRRVADDQWQPDSLVAPTWCSSCRSGDDEGEVIQRLLWWARQRKGTMVARGARYSGPCRRGSCPLAADLLEVGTLATGRPAHRVALAFGVGGVAGAGQGAGDVVVSELYRTG